MTMKRREARWERRKRIATAIITAQERIEKRRRTARTVFPTGPVS
jgi:hypothetical protein